MDRSDFDQDQFMTDSDACQNERKLNVKGQVQATNLCPEGYRSYYLGLQLNRTS